MVTLSLTRAPKICVQFQHSSMTWESSLKKKKNIISPISTYFKNLKGKHRVIPYAMGGKHWTQINIQTFKFNSTNFEHFWGTFKAWKLRACVFSVSSFLSLCQSTIKDHNTFYQTNQAELFGLTSVCTTWIQWSLYIINLFIW